jgi:hypothetical protein
LAAPAGETYGHPRTTQDLDMPVLVAALDDLISMKRAGGRPVDRSDMVALADGTAENV